MQISGREDQKTRTCSFLVSLNKSINLKACLPGFCAVWIPKVQWDGLNKDLPFLGLSYLNADYFAGGVWAEVQNSELES
jgi:hypothetical protein